jgi:hypothetical protein
MTCLRVRIKSNIVRMILTQKLVFAKVHSPDVSVHQGNWLIRPGEIVLITFLLT